ncbi:unnamed protein product, partial [Ectocarpus sp. 12 AP-2014]
AAALCIATPCTKHYGHLLQKLISLNCSERVERKRQQGVRGAAAERSQRDPHLTRGASCDQQPQQIQRQRTTTNTTNMAANGDGAVIKDGAVVEREETVESSAAKTTAAAVVPDVAVVAKEPAEAREAEEVDGENGAVAAQEPAVVVAASPEGHGE